MRNKLIAVVLAGLLALGAAACGGGGADTGTEPETPTPAAT